jgi:uncharacterized protein
VLDGVRDLLSERWAEDAALVGALREWLWAEGRLPCSRLVEGKDGSHPDAAKFRDYFDYAEPARTRAQPPRAGRVPRPRAGVAGRQGSCWSRAEARSAHGLKARRPLAEGRIARHLGWRHAAARPADDLLRTHGRLDLEGQALA